LRRLEREVISVEQRFKKEQKRKQLNLKTKKQELILNQSVSRIELPKEKKNQRLAIRKELLVERKEKKKD